jgi:hypothetical protein
MTLSRLTLCLCLLGTLLVSCSGGGGGGSGSLQIINSVHAIDGATGAIVINERWIVFLADEATTGTAPGSDLNGDGDRIDQVPVVMDMAAQNQQSLGVAAQQIFIANAQVYLVVEEAQDGQNWESPADLGANTVLLHWSDTAGVLTYVDTLEDTAMAVSGNLVFFTSLTATPTVATESNIRVIDAGGAPLVPLAVPTDDVTDQLEPIILGVDEGMIYLGLDEVGETRDLNGDADMLDVFVLALLDGTTVAGTIMNTGLAVENALVPFRANNLGPGDWLIGFLVSEADQAGVSLNDLNDFDPGWLPMQCPAVADVDTTDQVLHYLTFATWVADPVMNPIRNTGLAGTLRVLAVSNHVGTISPEADDGCDLNNDGDSTDDIFRWTEAVPPASAIVPETDVAFMHALFALAGGTGGVAELENRWVIVVDEAADSDVLNDDGLMDDNILGWHNPAAVALGFTFDHQPGAGEAYVGVTWMQEQPDRSVLPIGFLEEYTFAGNGDGDTTDTFPSWADFDGGFTELLFPGVARAVEPTNVGLVVQSGLVTFRVSEADDGIDWNGDGDMLDHHVFRSGIVPSFVSFVGEVTNDVRPTLEVDRVMTFGGAFIGDEPAAMTDLNGDTDTVDDVLRYFRF